MSNSFSETFMELNWHCAHYIKKQNGRHNVSGTWIYAGCPGSVSDIILYSIGYVEYWGPFFYCNNKRICLLWIMAFVCGNYVWCHRVSTLLYYFGIAWYVIICKKRLKNLTNVHVCTHTVYYVYYIIMYY